MSTAGTASKGCGHLVPSFIGLDMFKKSNELCQQIPELKNLQGIKLACGSDDFMNELDRKALCTLFCCCNQSGGKQNCVKDVLWQSDGFRGYKGHYKAEVPYLGGEPRMSRSEPERATRGRPGGSRIPDVVVVKDGSKPPTLDNIQKVYEMKFPGDKYDDTRIGPDKMTQQKAYKKIFQEKIDEDPMTAESCGCDDKDKLRENASVLQKASEWAAKRDEAIAMKPLFNDDMWPAAASVLGGGAGSVVSTAAAWFQRAAQVLKFAF